jgi:hypothetical protein
MRMDDQEESQNVEDVRQIDACDTFSAERL